MEEFKVITTRTQNSSEVRVHITEEKEIYYSLTDLSLYLNKPPKYLANLLEGKTRRLVLVPSLYLESDFADRDTIEAVLKKLKQQKQLNKMLHLKATEYLRDKNFELRQVLSLL